MIYGMGYDYHEKGVGRQYELIGNGFRSEYGYLAKRCRYVL
jgi:hypothetical protein